MKTWKRILLIVVVGIVMLIGVAASYIYFSVHNDVSIEEGVPAFRNKASITRLDSSSLAVDSLERHVKELMTRANVYGLAIAVINNGQTVYQQYFGFKNKQRSETFVPGTIFYGASLSKTILADVTIQLVEEDVLRLDTPLYRYLKKPLFEYQTNTFQQLLGANAIDYTSFASDDRYKEITARMCLSHTTGLPNWRWLEADQKLKIRFDPGERYSYSGEGMFLLQVVLEELTGKKFHELAAEKVFNPLGMHRSSFVWQRAYEGNYCVGHDSNGHNLRIPKRNTSNAAGSLSTTLEDYTIFFNHVLGQKEKRYQELVTPQIRIGSKQQFGPEAFVDTNDNDSIQLAYGLGFGLYNTPYGKAFFKEGHLEGWQHYAVGFPSKGLGLIMMANSDNAESIYKELIELITANTYTPWYWEGYIPYNHSRQKTD